MKGMGSNDGFKMIHTGGMDGDFVIPLNEGFKHCVCNQDFPRRIFLESVKVAKDGKGIKLLDEILFGVICC